jgi:type IV pilus assembly protein PilA
MIKSILERAREARSTEVEGVEIAEGGFTLIELMVVLLIIAILLAIAIPTFLGVTGSANDRAAQSNLTNGLTEATAVYQGANQAFGTSGTIQTLMQTSAPEFTWQASATNSGNQGQISVGAYDAQTNTPASDAQVIVIASLSKTGTCWWVANLQQNVQAIAGDANAFLGSTTSGAAGYQNAPSGSAEIATAGTYYAKKATGGTHCNANYAETDAAGFNWGSSYSTAGVN